MRGCEAPPRASPSTAMAVVPAGVFGALCLRFVFVLQPGMATLVCHRKTGSWLNDGWCLLGGERVSRASWRKGPQKPGVRRVGGCTADGLLLVAAPASFSVFGLVEISYRKNSFLHCEIKRCFDLSKDFLLR